MSFQIKLSVLLILAGLGALVSCQTNKQAQAVEVTIERFDKALMGTKDAASLSQLLSKNPAYVAAFYQTAPTDTALAAHLNSIFRHPESKLLFRQVDSTFGDLKPLEKALGQAFGNIKAQFPDFKTPRVVATFSGLENDLYVSDSVIYISLESFIGPAAKYRPQQPDYILYRYQKDFLVPTIVRFISDKYNRTSEDGTLLDDMIYFGKSFAFTQAMLPEGSDSLIIAYPDSVMHQTWNAQDLVWAHMIDRKVLYDKNEDTRQRYLGERPKTLEIGPAAPGRIGQWLGWRIIQRYQAENPKVTLPELMKNPNSQQLFIESKYRGQLED